MDTRGETYRDLYDRQLHDQEHENEHSAATLLARVHALAPFESVLDVGCGLGVWLSKAQKLGANDVAGIEGEWIAGAPLQVPRECVQTLDLEQPFDLGRRFDLAMSVEVAEHLSPSAAKGFVESLTRHADVVLFSAAIPFQGGHHHVNEQFLPYWAALFEDRGYRVVDALRGEFWYDRQILWWLRQNLVLFANDAALARYPRLKAEAKKDHGPLSVVHPDVYWARMVNARNELKALQALAEMATTPGTYKVRLVGGQPTLRRVGK